MRWLLLLIVLPFVLNNVVLAMLTDPWAPFRFSGQTSIGGAAPADLVPLPNVDPLDLRAGSGFVSDQQRHILALAAGFPPSDAVVATAVSIAENGRGDPAALSPRNKDGSRDLGLWQINEQHWRLFGGAAALVDPLTNARAAYALWRGGGWLLWCTYPGGCGGGPGSPVWPQALARARAAANTPLPAGQA